MDHDSFVVRVVPLETSKLHLIVKLVHEIYPEEDPEAIIFKFHFYGTGQIFVKLYFIALEKKFLSSPYHERINSFQKRNENFKRRTVYFLGKFGQKNLEGPADKSIALEKEPYDRWNVGHVERVV